MDKYRHFLISLLFVRLLLAAALASTFLAAPVFGQSVTDGTAATVGLKVNADAIEGVPSWINESSWQEDDAEIVVVRTEGFFLRGQASLVVMDMVRGKVSEKIDGVVGSGASRLVKLPATYINRHLIDEELVLSNKLLNAKFSSGSEKFVGYAKLRFDDAFRQFVTDQYQKKFRSQRVTWSGVVGGLMLSWLAITWSYLKLDHSTRHFYSRRLQTIALVTGLVLFAVAVVVAVSLGLLGN